MPTYTARVVSPVGPLTLAAQDGRLIGLWLAGQKYERAGLPADAREDPEAAPFPRVRKWLAAYFDGRKPDADSLPLDPQGTEFQRRVWALLRQIPYGRTVCYGQLARRLRTSARAIGSAVARNPISILIPCHRVLGADGALTGYAGGLEVKRRLLLLEGSRRGEESAGNKNELPGRYI